MAKNTPVTYEEVSAAAKRLEREGLKVSVRSVRSEIGDRGSHGTIGQLLTEWRKQREAVSDADFPPAFLKAMHDQLNALVKSRTAGLNERLEEERKQAAKSLEEIHRLEAEVSRRDQQLATISEQLALYQSRFTDAQAETRKLAEEQEAQRKYVEHPLSAQVSRVGQIESVDTAPTGSGVRLLSRSRSFR